MKEIERVKRHWDGLPNTMMEDLVNLFEALDKRISKLEGGLVASADALADLEYRHLKRIEALEDSVNQIRTLMPYMDEPAPHTCGECKRPWSRQGWGDPKSWVLLCEYETGKNDEYRVRDHSQPACEHFEAIK